MLEQIHRHMSWIMWAIIILIVTTFLFFGIYPSNTSGTAVANVNGESISSDELNRAYRNLYDTYKQIFKDQMNDALVKTLRSQALRELVRNELLIQEADRLGINVSDEELRISISQIPAFSQQGAFDKKIYDYYLQRENISPPAFETQQREYLKRKKLVSLIEDGVDATETELSAAYAKANPKAKPGDFEKSKESFRKSHLQQKQSEALDAYVKGLESKAKIKMNKEFALAS